MAYGLKYWAEYKREDAGTTRLEIEELDYTMYATEVKCTSLQWVQGNGNASLQEIIRGTKLNIGLATIDGQEDTGFDYDFDFAFDDSVSEVGFEEFYTQDETRFRVTMYRETGVIYFRGFILPDIFLDEYIDPVRIIQFTASDRLNRLVDVDINQFGPFASNRSIARLVLGARDNLLLDGMGVIGSTRMKESTGDPLVPTTTEISVNRNYLFEPDRETFTETARNFDTVLRNLGKTFFSQIFQWKGNIYFYEITNAFYDQADIATYEADPEDPTLATIDTSLTDISGIMLARPTIEGQPTSRRARVIHEIGGQLFDGFKRLVLWGQFEMNAWRSMRYSGGFRWLLRYWTYGNGADWSKQASRGEHGLPSENFVVMHRQSANIAALEWIESTNEGQIVTPQMLLRFSLRYQGLKTSNSKPGFEDHGAFFIFQLIIRNDTDTYYLLRNDAGAFAWTTTLTYIRIRFSEENFRVWNEFVVDDLVPPISGSVHVRLFQTLQTGSTARYRFHSAYDDVEVSSRANEELEDRDVTYEIDTNQGYSSFAEDWNTELGDFNNSFSESALMIGDTPTQFWAYNTQGKERILSHVLRLYANNITQPRLTINCRVRLPDLNITRGVLVDGRKYRINSASLDDAKNIWTLELQQVYS
jgi:hypothetical protein